MFESVNRRRTIRYYIGGISKDSNRAGLIDFLEYYGIKPAGVRMIETRRNSLSAKLTINSSDRHVIESEIWPKECTADDGKANKSGTNVLKIQTVHTKTMSTAMMWIKYSNSIALILTT